MKSAYKRILLKISGEGLAKAEQTGIDFVTVSRLAKDIADVRALGVEVGIVVGGGNFFRGAKKTSETLDRSVADQIGMLATVMNGLVFKSALESQGCAAVIYSGLSVPQVCDTYCFEKAVQSLKSGKVVIFVGGSGCPYFTTDTAAVLRAVEMHCEVLLKSTQVDGVYSADPKLNPQAERFDVIDYDTVIKNKLNVMDMTAISMAREAKLPIMIFAQKGENSIVNAICGNIEHTMIK